MRRERLTRAHDAKWLLRRKEAYSPVEDLVEPLLESLDGATITDPDAVRRVRVRQREGGGANAQPARHPGRSRGR